MMYGRQIEHEARMHEAFRREVTYPAAARSAAHDQARREQRSALAISPSARRRGGFRLALPAWPALLRQS
jgi:hypothetical protein